nr:PilZ domain-containing protein [Methylomarinum sp. Ch1-1]MDP4520570.1 PilZ domain-containing protein [Methylomarinum sp. Ch1-1]
MTETNKRRHQRLKHHAKIQLMTSPGETLIVSLRDLSESGLFLSCGDQGLVKEGDVVGVKTMESRRCADPTGESY